MRYFRIINQVSNYGELDVVEPEVAKYEEWMVCVLCGFAEFQKPEKLICSRCGLVW